MIASSITYYAAGTSFLSFVAHGVIFTGCVLAALVIGMWLAGEFKR